MRASARRDGYVRVTGDGTQSRGFIHVRDACRATLLAAQSDYAGPPLDICTGENHDMNEIAACFGVPVRHVAERKGDIKHIRQDPAAAKAAIGFTAEYSFSQIMAAYL
jgi:nucleoside-diphosphate-sugar epimerase